MIPGRTLHRLASIYCSTHTLKLTIEPQLADLQHEWIEATGRPRLPTLLRGYAAFWSSFVLAIMNDAKCHPRRAIAEVGALFTITFYMGVVIVLIKISGSWIRTGRLDLDFAPVIAHFSVWYRWAGWVGVFVVLRLLQPLWLPRGDR